MDPIPKFPEAELARVADGSLAPEREAELRRQIAADSELAAALAAQERAVTMLRAVDTAAPAALRGAVAARLRAAERPRRGWAGVPRVRIALPATALVAAIALFAVLLGGSGQPGPTLPQTVHLTLAAAVSPAPAEQGAARTLDISGAGIPFPYWQRVVGWRATGARADTVAGRRIVTVFYGAQWGNRVGYAIVSGRPIAVPPGHAVTRGGVIYRLMGSDGAELVTWLRNGHTCVIAGRGIAPGTLLRLATASA